MTIGKELVLRLPPTPASSRTARNAVGNFIKRRHRDMCAVTEFMTAVGEALANAIEHSRCTDYIEVNVSADGPHVRVTVSDHGIGFNHRIAASNLPPAFSERGRGLPIMNSCTDEFHIESSPGHGTVVTLDRNFDDIGRSADYEAHDQGRKSRSA